VLLFITFVFLCVLSSFVVGFSDSLYGRGDGLRSRESQHKLALSFSFRDKVPGAAGHAGP